MLVREGANAVIDQLRDLGLADRGSIIVTPADVVISAAADAAEEAVPGKPEVVWDELAAKTHSDALLSWSFLSFFSLAVILGGIGVLLDQPILIVGAMVLGPEFGAIAAVCFGLVRREALVGVFISVATIPAAAGVSVNVAFSNWHEVANSTAQLLLNLAGLMLAGTVTLLVQRVLWKRYGLAVPTNPDAAAVVASRHAS